MYQRSNVILREKKKKKSTALILLKLTTHLQSSPNFNKLQYIDNFKITRFFHFAPSINICGLHG